MAEVTSFERLFVERLQARDFAGIATLLHPEVRFRALAGPGLREAGTRAGAVAILHEWWGGASEFALESVEVGEIGERGQVSYRVRTSGERGPSIEQQYLFTGRRDGLIDAIELLGSGPVTVAERQRQVHQFDAGTMGCIDGLSGEFRRRILAIPVGDVLELIARDPSAKTDLPALARMMGHSVRSIETRDDGSLAITVERGQ